MTADTAEGTPAPEPATAAASSAPVAAVAANRPALLRLRSSILGKVLGALVVVLVVSTGVTALVDARLTHDAVARQTRQVAGSNLKVLEEAFAERQHTLFVNLRALANQLTALGLTEPNRRPELLARLGSEVPLLELDQLDLVDSEGNALDPPVSVGRLAPLLPLGRAGQGFTTEPTSRLLKTGQGPYVQSVPVPLGSGPRPMVLVGGRQFGDDLAFQLRRQLGGLPSVILVAGGLIAGTTLVTSSPAPPEYDRGAGGRPPDEPRAVRLNGVDSVVAYVPVGVSVQDPVGGAVGIALPDPSGPLNRELGSRRLVAGMLLAILAVALGWVLFRALTKPLVHLAGTATRIAEGKLDEPFVAQGSDEIAQLAGALEQMREELRAKLDVVARQALELQESSKRIVAAQDEERRRLARDLHDGIQQELVVLRMRLGLAQETAPAPDQETALLTTLGADLDHTIARLRDVSHELYPPILRDRGLAPALRSYAGKLPVASTLDVEPEPLPRLSPEVESAAYFLVCEAVTNALKHAQASELTLGLAAVDGHLQVRVRDDGVGFDAATATRHGGLQNMEDRVRSFGGDLRIESVPGQGTSVVATLPVVPPAGPNPSGAAERTTPPPPGGSYLVPH